MNKKELEERAEKALENACAYRSCGKLKNAMYNYGEYCAYVDLLEDMGIWYDNIIINEHCQEMIDILEEDFSRRKVE